MTEFHFEPNNRPKKKRSFAGPIAVMATLSILMIASVALLFLPEKETQKKPKATPVPTQVAQLTKTPQAPGEYEEFTGVVLTVDTALKTVTLYRCSQSEEPHTYVYTGSTTFYDNFGTQMTASMLQVGDMLSFTVYPPENRIVKADGSKEIWEKTYVDGLEVFPEELRLNFRNQNYRYNETICVISDGKQISLSEVLPIDRLTVRGIGQQVYEIIVTKGHGTISLKNHGDFIGGSITIGSGIADTITEEGTYLVKEGTYQVSVKNGSYSGTESVTVNRDRVTVFDVFAYGRGPIKTGVVSFTIHPLGATLYINGVKTPYYGQDLVLDYGIYSIEVAEGGYLSYQDKITVDSPKQSLSIFLSENAPAVVEDESASGGQTTTGGEGTSSGAAVEPTPTPVAQTGVSIIAWNKYELNRNNAIYILGPVGAEIYLDGEFLGVAPLDFEKIIGGYLITVIKENGDVKNINCTEADNGEDSYYNFDW